MPTKRKLNIKDKSESKSKRQSLSNKMSLSFLGVKLRVTEATAKQFYVAAMGMKKVNNRYSFTRGKPNTYLELDTSATARMGSNRGVGRDCYWKCGVLCPDVKAAADKLHKHGYGSGSAHQFLDIGYMSHVTDNSSMTTELLQWSFENDFKKKKKKYSRTTADAFKDATLGQLTIRTGNIEETLAFWQSLGWSIVSHQPVTTYGFLLYFLAAPDAAKSYGATQEDIDSIDGRQRLWSARFCTLEIQYFQSGIPVAKFQKPANNAAGFLGIILGCDDPEKMVKNIGKEPNGIPLFFQKLPETKVKTKNQEEDSPKQPEV